MMLDLRLWIKGLVITAGLYILSSVSTVFLPIILALVLSFILNPIVVRLSHISFGTAQRKMPKDIAILLAFFIIASVFTLMISYVLLPLANEFDKFIKNLPQLITRLQNISMLIAERTNYLELPQNVLNLINQTLTSAANFSLNLLSRLLNALINFASQIVELVVVPVLSYYFVRDSSQIKEFIISLFSDKHQAKTGIIIDDMGKVVSSFIRGQIIISIIMGFLVFAGLYILNVDYPLVLGILAALTETIPIVGPIIGAVPAIILAFLDYPSQAVKVIIFYIVLHQLENHIIVPKIMGKSIDLHPVVVIISLLIGGQLLGIVGMILAVPVAAIMRVLLKHLW